MIDPSIFARFVAAIRGVVERSEREVRELLPENFESEIERSSLNRDSAIMANKILRNRLIHSINLRSNLVDV